MTIAKRATISLIILFSLMTRAWCAPIHSAAEKGDLDKVKSILKEKPEQAGTEDPFGRTALHLAAGWGHKEVAALLIASGAKIDARDSHGRTPLYWAAESGHTDVVELLIAKGADVNATDKDGSTPLRWAAWQGHSQVAELIGKRGGRFGMDILDAASKADHEKVNSILATQPELAKAEDSYQWTALHWAAGLGYKQLAQCLIAKGANVNAKNSRGQTPLYFAASKGRKELVEVLVANAADPNVRDNDGWSVLDLAARSGHKDIVEFLLTKGARPDGYRGWTPLYSAVLSGKKAVVELLVAKGLDVKPYLVRLSRLGFFLFRQRFEIVRRLLEMSLKLCLPAGECGFFLAQVFDLLLQVPQRGRLQPQLPSPTEECFMM